MKVDALDVGITLFVRKPDEISLLGGFYNNVYYVNDGGTEKVVKVIPKFESILNDLPSVLELSELYNAAGFSCAKPITSIDGNFIEDLVINDEDYKVVCFQRLGGDIVESLDERQIKLWGQKLGEFHRIGKDLKPKLKPRDFRENAIASNRDSLPQDVLAKYDELCSKIDQIPKHRGNYGIIHNDFHQYSFLTDGNILNVFDLSESCMGYFVGDIAVCLYHALEGVPKEDRNEASKLFLEMFLNGYREENFIDDNSIQRLELFLAYRDIFSLLYVYLFIDHDKLDPEQVENLNQKRREILSGEGFLASN